MKSPHLGLFAALAVNSLFASAHAFDLSSGTVSSAAIEPLQRSTSARPLSRLRWFRPVNNAQTVFRAQSEDGIPIPPGAADPLETVDLPPAASGSVVGDPGLALPAPTTWNAFSPPLTTDPFLDGGMVQPYGPVGPPGPAFGAPQMGPPGAALFSMPGANGGRPYGFGWEQQLDTYLIPAADVSSGGAAGSLDEVGVNYNLGLTKPFVPGWILKETFQFRSRSWDGPAAAGPPAVPPLPAGLPGSAFRFGADFEFATPQVGPTSIILGVTPSINTDLARSATSDAYQLDGRGIIWWNLDSHWMFGLGAMFWDRVDDRVLPWAGWVYRDDYWELRLMFPETEIRLFLGNEPWWSKWLYIRSKYNIEAYEGVGSGGVQGEFEIEDWQLTAGFQMDAGTYRWFIEAGLVLDREIEYDIAPDITISTGFISRIGFRY